MGCQEGKAAVTEGWSLARKGSVASVTRGWGIASLPSDQITASYTMVARDEAGVRVVPRAGSPGLGGGLVA